MITIRMYKMCIYQTTSNTFFKKNNLGAKYIKVFRVDLCAKMNQPLIGRLFLIIKGRLYKVLLIILFFKREKKSFQLF